MDLFGDTHLLIHFCTLQLQFDVHFVVFALQGHLFVAHLLEHSQTLSSATTGHAGWVNLQYLLATMDSLLSG